MSDYRKTLTNYDANGSTTLGSDSLGNLFASGVAIKQWDGSQIYTGIYGTEWKAIAAESVDGINTVLWLHESGALHTWQTDDQWQWVSSDGWWDSGTLEFEAAEATFNIDANQDGIVGALTNYDANGSTTLGSDSLGNLFASGVAIKQWDGSQIYTGIYGTEWKAIAAESVDGINTVLWLHESGALHTWQTDDQWQWVSSDGWWDSGTLEFEAAEATFNIDANQDGIVGALTNYDANGSTTLGSDSLGNLFASGVAIKQWDGSQIYTGIYGTEWKAIAAESVDGINTVLWLHESGALHTWQTDDQWQWVSSDGWWDSGTLEFEAAEATFNIDANQDGIVGALTNYDANGSTTLGSDSLGNLFASGVAIKQWDGSQIYTGIYGTEWKAIAAESVDGINTVLWLHESGALHTWQTDDQWQWVSSDGWWDSGTLEFEAAEATFNIDANQDGIVGALNTVDLPECEVIAITPIICICWDSNTGVDFWTKQQPTIEAPLDFTTPNFEIGLVGVTSIAATDFVL